jgi:predicted transcriptional regulator
MAQQMMKSNNQIFLNLYKELESYLARTYPYAESPIKEHYHFLEKSPLDGARERADTLDILRILRNNLAHRNVDNLFEVSEDSIEFLRKEIAIVKDPLQASDIMIPLNGLYYAKFDTPLVEVIKTMYEKSYSHVPILDDENCVAGIFSNNALLTLAYKKGEIELRKEEKIKDYKFLIDLNFQKGEKFIFERLKTPIDEITNLLANKKSKDKIYMIFVTQSGLKNEPLLGIITPWDIINKKRETDNDK